MVVILLHCCQRLPGHVGTQCCRILQEVHHEKQVLCRRPVEQSGSGGCWYTVAGTDGGWYIAGWVWYTVTGAGGGVGAWVGWEYLSCLGPTLVQQPWFTVKWCLQWVLLYNRRQGLGTSSTGTRGSTRCGCTWITTPLLSHCFGLFPSWIWIMTWSPICRDCSSLVPMMSFSWSMTNLGARTNSRHSVTSFHSDHQTSWLGIILVCLVGSHKVWLIDWLIY